LYLLVKKKKKYGYVLVFWILLAFVPVAITRDSIPHALRTILAVAPFQIITAYGFIESLKIVNSKNLKRFVVAAPFIILLFSFIKYQYNFFTYYPFKYSRDWQYGYKEVVQYIKDHYSEYDKIVFTRHYGEPHMFTLFYMGWDPNAYQNDPNLNRFETFDWVRVLNFDKFYFPDLGDEGTKYQDVAAIYPNEKILFIGKPGDFPKKETLYEIRFLNGSLAFEIVEKI